MMKNCKKYQFHYILITVSLAIFEPLVFSEIYDESEYQLYPFLLAYMVNFNFSCFDLSHSKV
jgi:hypothetical protein